ncbi:MAG TPA: hypothetical protein VHZ97_21020, partial [Pseudonocardiaceae bacterium]|nr:hypothetical protein [Pseudonocardiaceae bacterium]
MTAATQSRSLSPALVRRAEVGWSDLAWLVWRQHRMLIGITTLAVLVAVGVFYWDSVDLSGRSSVYLEMIVVPAAAGVIGVFWGAPLVSVEYEQRTQLFVWAQDVSPVRWLVAKITILGATAAVLWG